MVGSFQKHFRPSLRGADGLKTEEMGASKGGSARIPVLVGAVDSYITPTPRAAFLLKQPHLLHEGLSTVFFNQSMKKNKTILPD